MMFNKTIQRHEDFSRVLDEVMVELEASNDPITSLLERIHDSQGELRSQLEAIRWLILHREALEPHPAFILSSRARLVKRTKTEPSSCNRGKDTIKRFDWRGLPIRNLSAPVTAILVAILIFIVVLISRDISAIASTVIPGDTLYPIKEGIENIQLYLTFSQRGQVALHIHNASSRLGEIQDLLMNGREELIAETLYDFEREIDLVVEGMVILAKTKPDEFNSLYESLYLEVVQPLEVISLLGLQINPDVSVKLDEVIPVVQAKLNNLDSIRAKISNYPTINDYSTASSTWTLLLSVTPTPIPASSTPTPSLSAPSPKEITALPPENNHGDGRTAKTQKPKNTPKPTNTHRPVKTPPENNRDLKKK